MLPTGFSHPRTGDVSPAGPPGEASGRDTGGATVLIVSDGQSVVGIPRFVRQVYSGNVLGVPTPILIGAAIVVVIAAVANRWIRQLYWQLKMPP